MSVDNKAVVRQHLERAWNQNNLTTIKECLSPEAVIYSGSRSDPFGPDQARARIKLWREAAADFQWHVEELISEGDSVVARLTFTGTHTGMLSVASRTLPATEKPFSVREIIIFRVVEGKIREVWAVWDRLSLLEQLGSLPG